jgi:hypothetical protein
MNAGQTPDPMTALGEGMVQMNEIYAEAVAAGFTEAQAMQIVLRLIIESAKKLPPGTEQ